MDIHQNINDSAKIEQAESLLYFTLNTTLRGVSTACVKILKKFNVVIPMTANKKGIIIVKTKKGIE